MTCILRALALVIAVLLGCSAATATPLCSLGVAPGETRGVTMDGLSRLAQVHVPTGRGVPRRLPLVLLLHGSGGSGTEILANSGLVATADRHRFLLIAPDGGLRAGDGHAWSIPLVPTIEGYVPGPGDPDDSVYLTGIIDALVAKGCVDPRRVYVTGLSGGGRMASWLGCSASHSVAAIAPVVGLRAGAPLAGDPGHPDPATCRPARPVSVLAFAGDADTTNPIAGGGAAYWGYSMTAAEARWANIDGCRGEVTRMLDARTIERRQTACRDQTEVIALIIRGGEHRWLADNEAIWRFFSRHRR